MVTLADGQFELDGFTFGGIWDNIKIVSVDFPEHTWDAQRADNKFQPGVLMGQDFLRPAPIEFVLVTDGYTADDAHAAAEALSAVWLRGGNRAPRTMAALRYRMGSRTRVVFGRGGTFSVVHDKWTRSGTPSIIASFEPADPYYYDDDERSVLFGGEVPSTGGLTAPLTAPLTAVGTGAPNSSGGFVQDVGGSAPTPVIVQVTGPTQTALVSGDGWSIEYVKPIAQDQTVTIDTRFGYTVAYDNFGRSLNQNLGLRTIASRARLYGPTEQLSYRHTDTTGQTRARVRWRPAYLTF